MAVLSATASAAVVFFDDFENGVNDATVDRTTGGYSQTADVNDAQSNGNTSGAFNNVLWVGATEGFGGGRRGLVDEVHGDFTDPVGEQAFAFRYTNSGLTTAFGVLGALQLGDTITVSFDVVRDGHNNADPYAAYLVTFDGASTRNNVTNYINNTSSILDRATGNATGTTYSTISFTYTVGDNVIDANGATGGTSTTFDNAVLGHDLAIRFDGATSTGIIDNVQIDIVPVPEPAAAMLGALGGLLLLRRRRC